MNEKCFAMRRDNVCGALIDKRCHGYQQCSFYKPHWMWKRDQDRTNVKLCELPEQKQRAIAEQYHNGAMPWRGERE